MRKILLAATMLVGGGLLLSAPAHAALNNAPLNFFFVPVQSTITFTFVSKAAADFDLMINGSAVPIFSNQATPAGTTFTDVFGPGSYTVQLQDLTPPNTNTWSVNPAANSDGKAHLKSTNVYGDFGLGAVAPIGPGDGGLWYGWEDRPIPASGVDINVDYNDFIFTVSAVPTTGAIPEPMSLALLGVGVAGAGLARMRKKA